MATYTPTATEIVHTTKVDFRRRPIVEAIHLMQYDSGMPIIAAELYSDGLSFQAPSGSTIKLRFNDRHGATVYSSALGTDSTGHIVYFRVTSEMTQTSGARFPVIELTYGDTKACSSDIPILIGSTPYADHPMIEILDSLHIHGITKIFSTQNPFHRKQDILEMKVKTTDGGRVYLISGDYAVSTILALYLNGKVDSAYSKNGVATWEGIRGSHYVGSAATRVDKIKITTTKIGFDASTGSNWYQNLQTSSATNTFKFSTRDDDSDVIFYYCKINNGETENYVPAKFGNVYGIYDTISETFQAIENQETVIA